MGGGYRRKKEFLGNGRGKKTGGMVKKKEGRNGGGRDMVAVCDIVEEERWGDW